MKITFLLTIILLGLIQNTENCGKTAIKNSDKQVNSAQSNSKEKTKFDRLPENVKLDSPVAKAIKNEKGETISSEATTVEKRLNELKARYENEKLVDGNGKEIKFFEPLCRGVSRGVEEDEQDRKEKENELAELEKKYTVIVLYCDPRKAM